MAGTYFEPQVPIMQNGDFYYPLTTAKQIILPDGRRLANDDGLNIISDNALTIDIEDTEQGVANNVNADTLGGVHASEYVLKGETVNNSNMLGGKAPEYYIQPRNLLDNSDFTNPVNQRGVFSASDCGYVIDRWMAAYQESVSITPVDGGLQITGRLIQKIPSEYFKDATPYTVAAYYTDGTHESAWGTHTYNMLGEWYDVATNDDLKIQLSVRGASEYLEATINTNKAIAGVAVYEGRYTNETLPPYVPKGYGAELAECQRYFVRFGRTEGYTAIGMAHINTDSELILGISLPQKMRLSSPSPHLNGSIGYRCSNSYRTCSSITTNTGNGHFITLYMNVNSNSGLSYGAMCDTYLNPGHYLDLSADL